MTPQEFFADVAEKNALSAIQVPGDLRQAINAIMTLDAFFGILHAALYAKGKLTESRDDDWKEKLAQENDHYRLLRDAVYALKHGELKHPKPRLVRRPDQLFKMPGAFQSNAFQRGAFQMEQVWIETDVTDYRADQVINNVTQFASTHLSEASL
jgi:hypothetical protein